MIETEEIEETIKIIQEEDKILEEEIIFAINFRNMEYAVMDQNVNSLMEKTIKMDFEELVLTLDNVTVIIIRHNIVVAEMIFKEKTRERNLAINSWKLDLVVSEIIASILTMLWQLVDKDKDQEIALTKYIAIVLRTAINQIRDINKE